MPVNMGTVDQYVRIVLGFALIAYAFQDGLAIQGWHWAGLVGVVPLTTAPVITGWVCAETVGDGKRMNTRAITRPTPDTRLQENGRTRPPFDTALFIRIL